jgi:sterol desaturase/sphingolipid hydroxylase (fatty acid hydroxylase superfamily)
MESLHEKWLLLISTPLYIIIIGLELLLTHLQQLKVYTIKGTISNIYLMLLNAGIDASFRIVYLTVFQMVFVHACYQFSNVWVYWIMLLLAEDFLYYWLHRFDHEIRLFWAVHVTHHSSEQLNFSVGFRSSVFEPLYRFIYFLPLAYFGFKPLDIAFMYSATQIWGTFVHTEIVGKLGWLEYILVTPSHHRVHHASNVKYLDKNMGMFLIIWDKLFGTFQKELSAAEYEPIKYGLTTRIEEPNAVNLVFHEWQSIWKDIRRKDLSLRQKFGYLFKAPGWSHDGSRLTSEQLLKQEEHKFLFPMKEDKGIMISG